MLHKFGRFLQFVGLFVVIPMAMVGQLRLDLTEGQMFMWVAVGALVFYAGRTLLRRS